MKARPEDFEPMQGGSIDWSQARRDVQRFVKQHDLPSLELWTAEFFLQRCARLGEQGSPW